MNALIAIGVFFGATIIDYADSRNTLAVATGQAHAAARWSVMMYLIGIGGLFAVMEQGWWFCFFEAGGLYLGSWLAVRNHPSSVARNR